MVAAGRATKKAVSVCGEMAVKPDLALALLALGVDSLSVVPTAIPELKQALASVRFEPMRSAMGRILTLSDALHGIGGTPPARPRTHYPVERADAIPGVCAHIENVAAAAYLGQIPRVRDPAVRAALTAIASVEARHAASLDLQTGGRITRGPMATPWASPAGWFLSPYRSSR